MAQEKLQRAAHVAWFFPTWWGAPPALVKGFIDRAFLPGFAFKNRPGNGLPETLLKGRSSRVVTSTVVQSVDTLRDKVISAGAEGAINEARDRMKERREAEGAAVDDAGPDTPASPT